ncbi:MAG: hypothetical protein QHI48_11685 [Bacteroidota bacterium]|nr:hypothetical protein [Bacteroidota bacterium]
MKSTIIAFLTVLCFIGGTGCSEDPPAVRVRNDYTKKANCQFKPSAGSTFNINDVEPGTATGFQEVPETTYDVTATIQGSNATPTARFKAENDYRYTVVVTNNEPPTLRVDSEER